MATTRQMAGNHAKWLFLTLAATACANGVPSPATGGFAIAFAALSEGGQSCKPTWNGTGTLPSGDLDPVDHLTLHWTAVDTGKSATARVSAADVASNGAWNVGALPISNQLQLQVYGCTADDRVVWYGKGSDFVVTQGEETTARVFMTPPGRLACAGSGGTGGSLQSGRAFSGGATLSSGNAVVAGGADKWDGTTATGSVATDLYDYKMGRWRAGPSLLTPRVWPHVLPLDATHVLVTGGTARLAKTNNALEISLFAPDDGAAAKASSPPAEVLEIRDDANKPSTAVADVGVGGRPFNGAAVAADAVVFVGGLGEDGKGLATGTRVRGLAALAQTGAGQKEALTLAAARIQPVVLSYADGTVVVWGGQTSGKAADFGELIAQDGTAGTPLTAFGDAVLTDPNAPAIGAAAVMLTEQGDLMTFLVTGGVAPDALWATATPSYLVTIDRVAKTAVCKPVSVPTDVVLPRGIGVAASRVDANFILLSGGLMSLGQVSASADDPQSLCQTDAQFKNGCFANGFVLLDIPTDLSKPQVALTAQKIETLAPIGPHVGQVALSLPVGAVLVGGLETVLSLPAAATDAFDALAQIVSAPFSQAASQAACKP